MTERAIVPATATVPFAFRFILTVLEPLAALHGAWMCLYNPGRYLAAMTRDAFPLSPSETYIYTTVGGSWIYFAFLEAVVMRLFDDVRLWRYLCAGILMNDAVYCHATAQAVGGWEVWLDVGKWTRDDYVVFWSTWPLIVVRVLVVLGIGLKKLPDKKKHE
ncbi:hypothetical protein CCM_05566 [Cordyceps militaris CM01]|uniref:DUF7704 domain-containing protein n=1 Tax=Cordyceps militaris (strain CM01) TaxID=983644 RepID=G3JKC4_CORMM|nr:uncharacterized protein CCM_05566 [Cordyceps militaris CM01]EGX91408.1 hypothetical protein CCM_05566 [Cordyceps militaris CM01]